jgi:fluoroquinolone transport system ATP-binding protein
MKLLKMVGLEDAAKKRAGRYSKGMLQRLVFARSMVNNPKIWFLDEPTSGLDPTTAGIIKNIIKEKQKAGTTIFLTTHNMSIADELCDRVGFITDGSLKVVDSPRNLKLKYGEKFVKIEYRDNGTVKAEKLSAVEGSDREKLKRLLDEGKIETMHTMEATLEEIFIMVTGKELK